MHDDIIRMVYIPVHPVSHSSVCWSFGTNVTFCLL